MSVYTYPRGIVMQSRPMRSRVARVGPAELAKVHCSGVLAIDASLLGGTVALLDSAPVVAPQSDVDGPTVATVRVDGPLAQRAFFEDMCAYVDGYDAVTARFRDALDSDADSILMILDSPGGDVAGLQSAVDQMLAAKNASGKQVVVYVDEQAASAAYWIAAALADEIVVPAAGRVGSIGCIGAFLDESAAWNQAGVKWHVVRHPAGKAESMPAAPLTELATARLTESVRATGDAFIEAMAGYRGISAAKIREFDAAQFDGAAAFANGLADRVGSLGDAITLAASFATERKTKMKLSPIVAAQVGLVPDSAVEAVADRFETVALEIMGATGADSLATAAPKLAAMKAQLEEVTGANQDLAAEVVKLSAEVKTRDDETEAGKLAALIDKLSTDGRLPPSKREAFAAKAKIHGLAWAQDTAEMLPTIATGRAAVPTAVAAAEELSAREIAMCADMKIETAVYAANKAAAAARKAG